MKTPLITMLITLITGLLWGFEAKDWECHGAPDDAMQVTKDSDGVFAIKITLLPGADRPVTPSVYLGAGRIPAKAAAFVCEIRAENAATLRDGHIRLWPAPYGRDLIPIAAPSDQWQTVQIPLSQYQGGGPEKIRLFGIGCRTEQPQIKLFVRNIRFVDDAGKELPLKSLAIAVSSAIKAAATDVIAMAFEDGKELKFITQPKTGLKFRATDWLGNEVDSGMVPAATGTFTLQPLPRGYYQITLKAPGSEYTGARDFAVIADPETRVAANNSYSIDAAIATLEPVRLFDSQNRQAGFEYYMKLCKLAGLQVVRERLTWREVEPKLGEYNPGKYDLAMQMYDRNRIKVCQVYHDTPDWGKTASGKMPDDMMTAYRFAYKVSSLWKGKIIAWEFWNEPDYDFANEPVWEQAAMHKATYLGIKAADPGVAVLNGSLCLQDIRVFGDRLLENDLAEYFDIFNFHLYSSLSTYPKQIGDVRAMLAAAGAKDKPIWITENGMYSEGHARSQDDLTNLYKLDFAQELLWAEFVPKSQLICQFWGIDRVFTFLLPDLNEVGGKKNWGLIRADHTVKPAFVALSVLTDQLGAAELLGKTDLGREVEAYLFRGQDGKPIVAAWRRSNLDTKVVPQSQVDPLPNDDQMRYQIVWPNSTKIKTVDIFGTVREIPVQNGKVTFELSRYPTYLHNMDGLVVSEKPVASEKSKNLVTNKDLSIVVRAKGLPCLPDKINALIRTPEETSFVIEVGNFSEIAKCGRILCDDVDGLPGEIELPPFTVQRFPVTLRASDKVAYEMVIGGDFNGRNTSTLKIHLTRIDRIPKDKIINVAPDASLWHANSSGEMKISTDQSLNAVRFDVAFAPGVDQWVYPEFPLSNLKIDNRRIVGFSFEILKDKELKVPDGNNLIMLATPTEYTKINCHQSLGTWEKNTVAGYDFTRFSLIRIGCNPPMRNFTYFIRNLKFILE